MQEPRTATVHASAVLAGPKAILIRGPSGSGKSRLALALIEAAARGLLPFARLIADDRVHLAVKHDRLLASTPRELAGLIEVRGLGLRRLPFEPVAAVGLVVDLDDREAPRLPDLAHMRTSILGVTLTRLGVLPGTADLELVLAALRTPIFPV